jgi:hypothetical protein
MQAADIAGVPVQEICRRLRIGTRRAYHLGAGRVRIDKAISSAIASLASWSGSGFFAGHSGTPGDAIDCPPTGRGAASRSSSVRAPPAPRLETIATLVEGDAFVMVKGCCLTEIVQRRHRGQNAGSSCTPSLSCKRLRSTRFLGMEQSGGETSEETSATCGLVSGTKAGTSKQVLHLA